MFKFALDAGHGLKTSGKRCLKKLDPEQTREWTLNDRIADKVEKLLAGYTGYELIRVDDTTGQKNISLDNRVKAANNFNADFYLSIHHNAGINGGSGGGIVAYTCKNAQSASTEWRKELYNELIAATGLKGNRSNPMPESNFRVIKKTKMPSVLLELGFMDSKTDVPIILSEKYADQCAAAIVKVVVKRGKLEKKAENKPATNTVTASVKAKDAAKSFLSSVAGTYRVTASALNVRHGAGATKKKMVAIPNGTKVQCYGYYTSVLGTKWLYIQFTYKNVQYTGFASSKYLKK